jgi:large exoprotein involved in heme utilization and adhesion
MNRAHFQSGVLTGEIWGALLCAQSIRSQVVPDRTLPAGETWQVTGNSNFQTDGGTRQGGNLFNSFQSFCVPTGGSAHFNNATDVQNIFSPIWQGQACCHQA